VDESQKRRVSKTSRGSQHFRHLTRIAPTTFAKPPSTNQRSSPYFLSHSAQSITSATIDLPQWRHDCRSRCHPYRPRHRRPFTAAHRIITATSAFPHTPAHFSEPNRRIRSHRIGPDSYHAQTGDTRCRRCTHYRSQTATATFPAHPATPDRLEMGSDQSIPLDVLGCLRIRGLGHRGGCPPFLPSLSSLLVIPDNRTGCHMHLRHPVILKKYLC